MPQLRQAKKRLRQNRKRAIRNRVIRSELKTLERRVREAVHSNDREAAQAALKRMCARFDVAARKGRVAPNAAARKKSQCARLVNGMGATPSAAEE